MVKVKEVVPVDPIRLRTFNPNNMIFDRIVLLLGGTGCGKTTLMLDLVSIIHANYDIVIGVSPTEDTLKEFRKFIPPCFIFDDVDQFPELLDKILDTMLFFGATTTGEVVQKNILLIMDDCGYNKKLFKGPIMSKLFMNGRHNKICLMFLMQYMMSIDKGLRPQITYLFCCKEDTPKIRKDVYDSFGGCAGDHKTFDAMYQKCTQNYGVFVCDKLAAKKDSNITSYIYHYKASLDTPTFLTCNRNIWKLYLHFKVPNQKKYLPSISSLIPALNKKKKEENEKVDNALKSKSNPSGGLQIELIPNDENEFDNDDDDYKEGENNEPQAKENHNEQSMQKLERIVQESHVSFPIKKNNAELDPRIEKHLVGTRFNIKNAEPSMFSSISKKYNRGNAQ